MALWRCQVVGSVPIRDALTRESVPPGGVVVLDDSPRPREGEDGRPVSPLAGTLIRPLERSGVVKVLGPHTPTGPVVEPGGEG